MEQTPRANRYTSAFSGGAMPKIQSYQCHRRTNGISRLPVCGTTTDTVEIWSCCPSAQWFS
ncbi:MAG: hypothetical protein ACLR5S_01750 [Ruminococcus sp.]